MHRWPGRKSTAQEHAALVGWCVANGSDREHEGAPAPPNGCAVCKKQPLLPLCYSATLTWAAVSTTRGAIRLHGVERGWWRDNLADSILHTGRLELAAAGMCQGNTLLGWASAAHKPPSIIAALLKVCLVPGALPAATHVAGPAVIYSQRHHPVVSILSCIRAAHNRSAEQAAPAGGAVQHAAQPAGISQSDMHTVRCN